MELQKFFFGYLGQLFQTGKPTALKNALDRTCQFWKIVQAGDIPHIGFIYTTLLPLRLLMAPPVTWLCLKPLSTS